MKIVAISDTHNRHGKVVVPDADVFVHSGDITVDGTLKELENFAEWLSTLKHSKKLIVSGNHDWFFARYDERKDAIKMIEDAGGIYLQDSGIEIDGVKFYGSPWQPVYGDYAFNLRRKELGEKWALIPEDTNVLITHAPPQGIADVVIHRYGGVDNAGCIELLYRVRQLDHLKVHIFGHIHSCVVNFNLVRVIDGVTFINACSTDSVYDVVNPARVVDI